MVGFHALVMFMVVVSKHGLTQLLLELLDQPACFLSARQLEVIKKREVEVEWIKDLWFDLRLHLRQRRVGIVQGLHTVSEGP
jgi:hypothetical protein